MGHTLLKPLALGVGLVALALLALAWDGAPSAAHAAGPTCTVCLDGGCDYAAVQAAVDDEGCQEIKVAQGVYTGVQARLIPTGYPYSPVYPPTSGLITQVVYISRTVAVRGAIRPPTGRRPTRFPSLPRWTQAGWDGPWWSPATSARRSKGWA